MSVNYVPRSLIMDLKGLTLSKEERNLIQHPSVAGIILFSRNFKNCNQLLTLVNSIKEVTPIDFIIAVDHEGGRVQRFKSDGFTHIPSMKAIQAFYTENLFNSQIDSQQTVVDIGWLMAKECLVHGINLSFAPVLDIDNGSDVIGDRAFSSDPTLVSELAQLFIKGMKEAGLPSVAKHFPGHGSTKLDSHIHTPVDLRLQSEIERQDLIPFKQLIEKQCVDAVMPAHIIFPDVDSLPVGYSKKWLNKTLRNELNFEGVIFSDDLSMVGAGIDVNAPISIFERYELAMAAGCNYALVCNDPDSVKKLIKRFDEGVALPKGADIPKVTAALKFSSTCGKGLAELLGNDRYQKTIQTVRRIHDI
jgi:beta-N-acetylhexosaminidase